MEMNQTMHFQAILPIFIIIACLINILYHQFLITLGNITLPALTKLSWSSPSMLRLSVWLLSYMSHVGSNTQGHRHCFQAGWHNRCCLSSKTPLEYPVLQKQEACKECQIPNHPASWKVAKARMASDWLCGRL